MRLTGIIMLWLVPFMCAAGPTMLLHETIDSYSRQGEFVSGSPVLLVIVFAFAPTSATTAFCYLALPHPVSQWPRHYLSALPVPIAVTMASYATGYVVSDRTSMISASVIGFATFASAYVWLRRARPEWHHLKGLATLGALNIAAVLLVLFVFFPFFRTSSTTGQIVIRLSLSFLAVVVGVAQRRVSGRTWRATGAPIDRPWMPIASAAALPLAGRFLLVSIDSFSAQITTVIVLGLLELTRIVLTPFASIALAGGRPPWPGQSVLRRGTALLKACRVASKRQAAPENAASVVMRTSVEMAGIVVATSAILVHLLVWTPHLITAPVLVRLALFALIQVAVEVLVDAASLMLLTKRHDVDFEPILASPHIAAVSGLIISALLMITMRGVASLVADVVLALETP